VVLFLYQKKVTLIPGSLVAFVCACIAVKPIAGTANKMRLLN
jgi:hypothetical protein